MKSGVKLKVPRDVVFVNRTLAGHFGNLSRLRARGDWRARVAKFAGD